MVRILHVEESFLKYLRSFDTNLSWTIGLIIGQSLGNKDYGVHPCRTVLSSECEITSQIKSLSEINELWIAEHAKQAARMLPGGMHILGLFIISDDEIITPFPIKLKTIFGHLHKSLSTAYLYGNPEHNEKIIVNYCARSSKFICKSFDVITSNVKPVEYKVIDVPIKWNVLQCKYSLDELYHLAEDNYDVDLKRHINVILQDFHNNLKSSVILFDGELKNDEDVLEMAGKKKKIPRSGKMTYTDANNDDKHMAITILQKCDKEKFSDILVSNNDCQIKIIGQIYCIIFLHPNANFKMATETLIQDIMRSLSTRLEMHWDSLIEDENKEDQNTIHEPPRRVMVSLIEFCISSGPSPGNK